MNAQERYRGALLGLAAGDALGTTLEFRAPGSFTQITDIVGGGPFHLEPGQWTDDTSMALCLAESLVTRGGHDPRDQMERYVRWYREGYLSSNGRCFDIGNTVSSALSRFERTDEPMAGSTAPDSAGNGSLMRLAPAPLAYAGDAREAIRIAGESSRTTHGAREAVDACRYFAGLLLGALDGVSKETLLSSTWAPIPGARDVEPLAPKVAAVAAGSFRQKSPPQIRGTGYVVDALEAALWALHGANSFREACLRAVNLGDDADTTGAIVGQLAGALWGIGVERGVPEEWVSRLALRSQIESLADALLALATTRTTLADVGVGSGAVAYVGFERPAGEAPALPAALAPRAFWVLPGRFLAGAYPGDQNAQLHTAKVEALLELGIDRVVSLMEESEVSHGGLPFRPYAPALEEADAVVQRYPIRDVTAPSVELVRCILDAIDDALGSGHRVYVHCWGGRGRTGVIVGCWMVRHGWAEPDQAVAELGRLRARCVDVRVRAPDTREQVERIVGWRPGQ